MPTLLGAFAFVAATVQIQAGTDVAKTIEITANDTLHYNVTRIEATPGEKLHVVLHNGGTIPKEVMGHNWVLLTADESADAYAAAAVPAKADDYEPVALKGKVIAAVPLLGPGQSAEITFTAPSAPGTYTYMCSFPAHCSAGMRGVLVVK
jgi:azurin